VVLPLPEASRLEPAEELVERVKDRWEASPIRKLPAGPEAPMQQTYLRQRRQWLEQLYSRSLEMNAPADAAWREQAATVVAHWVDYVSGKKTAKQPKDIAPLARTVIDGGCNDPLVRLVYGRMGVRWRPRTHLSPNAWRPNKSARQQRNSTHQAIRVF
jgi:hypothetical protein